MESEEGAVGVSTARSCDVIPVARSQSLTRPNCSQGRWSKTLTSLTTGVRFGKKGLAMVVGLFCQRGRNSGCPDLARWREEPGEPRRGPSRSQPAYQHDPGSK